MSLEGKYYGPYPKGSNFGSFEEFAGHISNSRDDCEERGYHLVESDENDPLICYHCDLWFGKDDCEDMGIEYKVQPL